MDFGAGDAAAVDLFDLEGGSEVEGGGGVVEDLRVEAGVEEGSEEHVATDAGEAVEVGDAHGAIVSRGERWECSCRGPEVRMRTAGLVKIRDGKGSKCE